MEKNVQNYNIDNDEFDNYNENSDDIRLDNLDTFNQAVIWSTDWTAETIVNQLKKGNIDVNPKFQRRDAWDKSTKSKFIESLILGIPIPPIILAESKTKKNTYIVIDGKQRLLTLRQFYAHIDDEFESLKLSKLDFLGDELNGCNYNDIEAKGLNQYINQLDNQVIRTVVIRNWPVEQFLYTVFLRLNTGSSKLSPQELRQALHPGKFLDFVDDATSSSTQLMKVLNNKKADTRMRDVELTIRFYAFRYFSKEYSGNLKKFLDDTCIKLNTLWSDEEDRIKKDFEDFENSIKFTYKVFGSDAFTRYNRRFNRSIFELETYYFSDEKIRKALRDGLSGNYNELQKKFRIINEENHDFIDSVSSTTKDIRKVEYRFNVFADLLSEFVGFKVKTLRLHL